MKVSFKVCAPELDSPLTTVSICLYALSGRASVKPGGTAGYVESCPSKRHVCWGSFFIEIYILKGWKNHGKDPVQNLSQ